MKGLKDQVLDKYDFKLDKPALTNSGYSVYHGAQKQKNTPVTIKMLKFPNPELCKYLRKLKDSPSDHVIKILDIATDDNLLVFVTEQVTFPTLKAALTRCERLEDNDALFIAKILLSGHVDLMRSSCNWFGTEEDIQFTEGGIKLSWNNGASFNVANPFPNILSRLNKRKEINQMLPFPQIKAVQDLIKISHENASEISMHPQMKKKDKLSKKKGKNWIALREVKNKNQYFDEYSYFAMHRTHGFVRVKIYDEGKISPNLLMLNKTKENFTKLIDHYDEKDKTILISEYSNDGSLQSYITKLKSSGVTLKEDHIEYFYFSLFEPLKSVQASSIKSLNMLHIKNIYIQNGIPKIGEPVPMNQKIIQILNDRTDVPDFYHSGFKKQPHTRSETFDTYSLGVLLYKLMYTEYPIFPNGKVPLPTTPAYNRRLKVSLEIFLNEGGRLRDIQDKIQVSDTVLKHVKENQQKLMVGFNQGRDRKNAKADDSDDEHDQSQKSDKSSVKSVTEKESIGDEDEGENFQFWEAIKQRLEVEKPQKVKDQVQSFNQLQNSPYRHYRTCAKILLVSILYTFMFYYSYIYNNFTLLNNQNLIETINITISGTNYSVLTTDLIALQTEWAKSSQTVSGLETQLNCLINNYNGQVNYSEFLYDTSPGWIGYLLGALLTLIFVLALKWIQIIGFDEVKAFYNRQNAINNFNIANWLILNLSWLSILNGHFFFFNFVFNAQTEPCIGYKDGNVFGSTFAIFNDRSLFVGTYLVIFLLQIALNIAQLIYIACGTNLNYSMIKNPMVFFGIPLAFTWLIVRVGAIMNTHYYPSWSNDTNSVIPFYFQNQSLYGVLGLFPEFIFLFELLIVIIIDWVFWNAIDKKSGLLANEDNVVNESMEEIV